MKKLGRPPLRWLARLTSVRFPGGFTSGGSVEPKGTVHLAMRADDAGTYTGRDIDVVITPDQLDAIYHLISRARKVRDK